VKNIIKLTFLALVSAFLVGCGESSSGSEDKTAADKFMSVYPAFDDRGAQIANNYIKIEYKSINSTLADIVNATLLGVKDFKYTNYSSDNYEPNYNITVKNLTDARASVYTFGNYSRINFSLLAQNRTIAYSEFDDIFGPIEPSVAANTDISSVSYSLDYDVDVSEQIVAYHQKLLDSGVFKEADCLDSFCRKSDETFDYLWEAGVVPCGPVVTTSISWSKSLKNPNYKVRANAIKWSCQPDL